MTTATKKLVIDADAHVIENEHTWDYLDPDEEQYRPELVAPPSNPARLQWYLDGQIRGARFPSLSERQLDELSRVAGRTMTTAVASRELTDVDLRLRHMDEIGVDIQILYNTIFITQVTQRPRTEVAICKSWNRWMAEIWKQGKGRLRWTCVLPVMTMSEAIKQLEFARDNGACAVLMRPIEGDLPLPDPYFDPIFDAASALDMGIAVHIANANPQQVAAIMNPNDISLTGFWLFRGPTVGAAMTLVGAGVPQRFPKLRFGFVEASAQWIPWMVNHTVRYLESRGKPVRKEELLRENRFYVTLQSDDDVPYLLQYGAEDSLMIGTDYGHTDPASELDAILDFKNRTDLDSRVKEKILSDNPKAFYGV